MSEESFSERTVWTARWGIPVLALVFIISGVIMALVFIWNDDILDKYRSFYSDTLSDEEVTKINAVNNQLKFMENIFWTSLLFLVVYGIVWLVMAYVVAGHKLDC